jgi:hypothetical protein
MNRVSFARLLLAVLLPVGLWSCGPRPSNAALEGLGVGTSPQQARQVLGAPTQVESLPFGAQKAERWVYGQEPDQVELVFLGGKLISQSGRFPGKP